MDLDWFIFASPNSSYTPSTVKLGELLFIPKREYQDLEADLPQNKKYKHVPCLFLKANSNSTVPKFALFFHGNAEDINLATEMLDHIRNTLSINVIAPEFAGYGIYSGYPTEGQIFNDSLSVYDYLTGKMGISPNNIIIFGRSLGTSVATHLASKRKPSALILISPPLSIRHVVADLLGRFVSYAVKNRFKSYKMIGDVECPILIIHGQVDSLIKYYHATELYNLSKAPCELILPENMDHNQFDFFHEFSEPLLDFISRNEIFSGAIKCDFNFDAEIKKVPEEFLVKPNNWNCITKLLNKFKLN